MKPCDCKRLELITALVILLFIAALAVLLAWM